MVSFKTIIGFLFVLIVTTIMVLGAVSYRYSKESISTSLLVTHTHQIIEKANEVASLYKDMQLESNAIFIGRDTSLISNYRAARNEIFLHLEDMRKLAKDSRQQIVRMDSLHALLKNLAGFTDSVLIAPPVKAFSNNVIERRIEHSKFLRMRIRSIVNRIKRTEKELLVKREEANQKNITAFRNSFIQLLIGIALLLLTTFFSIRYNFNKRIRVENELKSANELFGKIFYESPVAILITEKDSGVILNCNKVYASLVNYSMSELIGRTATDLGIFESNEQRDNEVKAAVQKGMAAYVETFIRPRSKENLWVSITAQPIQVRGKDCILKAIVDESSHKRAEEEVKNALATEIELNKMKSNFVTLASHEFRTPLTTIASSAFLLEKYFTGENHDKVQKHISRIKSSVNNLTSILDEFLSVTKIEEGQIHSNIRHVDLKQYLENTCLNLQTFAKAGQTIVYSHSGNNDVYTDPVLFGSIVTNLISNSIKYSPENSTIYVSSLVNSKLHLSVKDSGIGIPEEEQKHLYERFFRASNAGAVQGTGLGLHIIKHYVDILKGTIRLSSREGKGTEFEVALETPTPEKTFENHTLL